MEAGGAVPEVAVWTEACSAANVSRLLKRMEGQVRPIALGGPPSGALTQLGRDLGLSPGDDLRKLLVESPPAWLLLATSRDVGRDDLLAATSGGTLVLALEPVAADLASLAALAPHRSLSRSPLAHGRVAYAPAFGESPGFRLAAESFEMLGSPAGLISIESVGREGSLFARLQDAWQTLMALSPLPVSVDASLVGPDPEVPDRLPRLSGSMGVHARMPEGGSAVLHVSDHAGDPRRGLHILSERGQFRADDAGYGLFQNDGSRVDGEHLEAKPGYVDLLTEQWRRMLDRPVPTPPPEHTRPEVQAPALACCLACLLSARTAQPEDPRRVLEMTW